MAKRGAVVQVRATSLRIVFRFNGIRYKESLKTEGLLMRPTAANIRYAEKMAAEIQARIDCGAFVFSDYFSPVNQTTGSTLTTSDQLDVWLAAQRVSKSTHAGYSSAARFWKSSFGSTPLRLLKHSQVKTALARRPDLSGKTINNYTDVLRQAVALAIRDKTIAESPVDGVERAVWQREPADPFSLEEAEAIISTMRERSPAQIYNLVEWWFFSGVRTSEMAGLHWRQVDTASGYMRINHALVLGEEKDRTKTGVSRDVLLNSRAAAALGRQRSHTQPAGQHVWLNPRDGEPWTDERAFRRSHWTPTLKLLGIRYRRPYNMRHTFATMMLMAGRTPGWCAGQLGHSVEIFLGTYAKWLAGDQDRRELDGFERWLEGTGT